MYKELTLKKADGTKQSYAFKATGSTVIRYRQVFREDLLSELRRIEIKDGELALDSDLTVVDKLAFIMNAQAEGKDISKLSFDSFVSWVDELECGELMEHTDEIITMYLGNKKSDSSLKKRGGPQIVK